MGVLIPTAPRLRSGPMRVLVLGYGNPGRRDDGLGPRLAEELSRMALPGVDVDSAYQFQAEDAAAVADHDVVVFVDADVSCPDPFEMRPVLPAGEPRFLHALAGPGNGPVNGVEVPGSDAGSLCPGHPWRGLRRLRRGIVRPGQAEPVRRPRFHRKVSRGANIIMREGKHVVLYVEDDADYQDMVREILEAADFEMVAASSAEEGIRAWDAEKPDLVIVDLMMEEVDAGTSLITDLRARGCDVPIYMLSSVGDDLAMSVDYGALGLAGVFQKPINGKSLVTILKARLD